MQIISDTLPANPAGCLATFSATSVLREAVEEVEDEEDEHLYHTKGWARELWIEALGMPAVLPPPEEEKDVRTFTLSSKANTLCQ
jgi:hypothetical protein